MEEITKEVEEVRENRYEKNNFLLNLAIDSKADFLLTGDNDLLILENIERIKIMTFNDFIKEIE
ncbi:MAG: putative toxin-antitoxin system toxin component, PIN family [Moheibacter sp.]